MPKYWGGNYLAHGSFPEVGQKQKTEKKEERLKVGNNNGQATHGARKHACQNIGGWVEFSASGVSLKWVKSKTCKKSESW